MIDRILRSFNKNITSEKRSPMWNYCFDQITKTIINETNLEYFAVNNLKYGIFGGFIPLLNRDTIMRLAEITGATGLNNPAGVPHNLYPKIFAKNFNDSELLKMIETRLGFKLKMPKFIGGLDVQGNDFGIVTEKHCFYLYVLKKIIELCPDKNSGIIEIGAGVGLLGYFLDQQGYKDYTSIDLSYSNAIQSYFLYRNLPESKFVLSGEVKNPYNQKYKNHIKILHSSDFGGVPKNRFNLMVNIDGLTEMNIDDARQYFESDCTDTLLSINHEVNEFRVVDLQGKKQLVYRYPFWLRDGYIEELYRSL